MREALGAARAVPLQASAIRDEQLAKIVVVFCSCLAPDNNTLYFLHCTIISICWMSKKIFIINYIYIKNKIFDAANQSSRIAYKD